MKTKFFIETLKCLCGLYVFFGLPIVFGLGVVWATAITIFAILVYLHRDKIFKENGESVVIIIFGIFAILASLFEETYSDYGDSLGTVLRSEPVWWLLGFGLFIIISGLISVKWHR